MGKRSLARQQRPAARAPAPRAAGSARSEGTARAESGRTKKSPPLHRRTPGDRRQPSRRGNSNSPAGVLGSLAHRLKAQQVQLKAQNEALRRLRAELKTSRERATEALAAARDQLAADVAGLTRLQEVSTRFAQHDDLQGLLLGIIDAAVAISGADMGNLQLFDPRSGELKLVAQRGFAKPFLDFFSSVNCGDAACGRALKRRERVIVEDVARSAIFAGSQARRILLEAGVRAIQSTPILSRTGQLLGVFSTHYCMHRRPDERELRLLDLLAQQAADFIERLRAEEELRESEERFRLLADHAPVMIWISGPDRACTWFNKPWLDFTGSPLEKELGDGWARHVHPDDRRRCLETYDHAFDARREFQMEYRLIRRDGEYRWVLDHGVPRYTGNEFAGYIGTCLDITDRRQAEMSLQLFRALLDQSNDTIHVLEAETGRFLDANTRAYEVLGYTREEFLKLAIFDIAPSIDRTAYDRNCAWMRVIGPIVFEGTHRRKDGATLPVEISLAWITLDRAYVLAIGRDITARKQAAAAQRQLSARLAHAQEEERARFSRELHDQTGDEIARFQLQLQLLIDDPATSGPVRKRLARLGDLMTNLANNVHRVARELRPESLDQLGLDKALRRHALEWSTQTGTRLNYRSSGLRQAGRIDPMIEITLYRIAQEALHNVWKHARARRVRLSLHRRPGQLQLSVEDNGRGFDAPTVENAAARQGRLGLAGMRERAGLIGGALKVQSRPRKGTAVSVSVPLADRK